MCILVCPFLRGQDMGPTKFLLSSYSDVLLYLNLVLLLMTRCFCIESKWKAHKTSAFCFFPFKCYAVTTKLWGKPTTCCRRTIFQRQRSSTARTAASTGGKKQNKDGLQHVQGRLHLQEVRSRTRTEYNMCKNSCVYVQQVSSWTRMQYYRTSGNYSRTRTED
jgi:hypothetical protein